MSSPLPLSPYQVCLRKLRRMANHVSPPTSTIVTSQSTRGHNGVAYNREDTGLREEIEIARDVTEMDNLDVLLSVDIYPVLQSSHFHSNVTDNASLDTDDITPQRHEDSDIEYVAIETDIDEAISSDDDGEFATQWIRSLDNSACEVIQTDENTDSANQSANINENNTNHIRGTHQAQIHTRGHINREGPLQRHEHREKGGNGVKGKTSFSQSSPFDSSTPLRNAPLAKFKEIGAECTIYEEDEFPALSPIAECASSGNIESIHDNVESPHGIETIDSTNDSMDSTIKRTRRNETEDLDTSRGDMDPNLDSSLYKSPHTWDKKLARFIVKCVRNAPTNHTENTSIYSTDTKSTDANQEERNIGAKLQNQPHMDIEYSENMATLTKYRYQKAPSVSSVDSGCYDDSDKLDNSMSSALGSSLTESQTFKTRHDLLTENHVVHTDADKDTVDEKCDSKYASEKNFNESILRQSPINGEETNIHLCHNNYVRTHLTKEISAGSQCSKAGLSSPPAGAQSPRDRPPVINIACSTYESQLDLIKYPIIAQKNKPCLRKQANFSATNEATSHIENSQRTLERITQQPTTELAQDALILTETCLDTLKPNATVTTKNAFLHCDNSSNATSERSHGVARDVRMGGNTVSSCESVDESLGEPEVNRSARRKGRFRCKSHSSPTIVYPHRTPTQRKPHPRVQGQVIWFNEQVELSAANHETSDNTVSSLGTENAQTPSQRSIVDASTATLQPTNENTDSQNESRDHVDTPPSARSSSITFWSMSETPARSVSSVSETETEYEVFSQSDSTITDDVMSSCEVTFCPDEKHSSDFSCRIAPPINRVYHTDAMNSNQSNLSQNTKLTEMQDDTAPQTSNILDSSEASHLNKLATSFNHAMNSHDNITKIESKTPTTTQINDVLASNSMTVSSDSDDVIKSIAITHSTKVTTKADIKLESAQLDIADFTHSVEHKSTLNDEIILKSPRDLPAFKTDINSNVLHTKENICPSSLEISQSGTTALAFYTAEEAEHDTDISDLKIQPVHADIKSLKTSSMENTLNLREEINNLDSFPNSEGTDSTVQISDIQDCDPTRIHDQINDVQDSLTQHVGKGRQMDTATNDVSENSIEDVETATEAYKVLVHEPTTSCEHLMHSLTSLMDVHEPATSTSESSHVQVPTAGAQSLACEIGEESSLKTSGLDCEPGSELISHLNASKDSHYGDLNLQPIQNGVDPATLQLKTDIEANNAKQTGNHSDQHEVLNTADITMKVPSKENTQVLLKENAIEVSTLDTDNEASTAYSPECSMDVAQVERTPLESAPRELAPLELTPLEPTPHEPAPGELTPLEPAPRELTPLELTPLEPAPLELTPLEPAPRELTPLEPAPRERTPLEPAPCGLSPFEPAPRELIPRELTPLEPAPRELIPRALTPLEPAPRELIPRELTPLRVKTSLEHRDWTPVIQGPSEATARTTGALLTPNPPPLDHTTSVSTFHNEVQSQTSVLPIKTEMTETECEITHSVTMTTVNLSFDTSSTDLDSEMSYSDFATSETESSHSSFDLKCASVDQGNDYRHETTLESNKNSKRNDRYNIHGADVKTDSQHELTTLHPNTASQSNMPDADPSSPGFEPVKRKIDFQSSLSLPSWNEGDTTLLDEDSTLSESHSTLSHSTISHSTSSHSTLTNTEAAVEEEGYLIRKRPNHHGKYASMHSLPLRRPSQDHNVVKASSQYSMDSQLDKHDHKHNMYAVSSSCQNLHSTTSFRKLDSTTSFQKLDSTTSFQKLDSTTSFQNLDSTTSFQKLDSTTSFEDLESNSLLGLFDARAGERLEERRAYLHQLVDRWHDKMRVRMHGARQRSRDRLHCQSCRSASELQSTPPRKTLAFLNLNQSVDMRTFGTFNMETLTTPTKLATENCHRTYVLQEANHIRSFETRDDAIETTYMATGLSVSHHGDYIVTDLGADTCRLFSAEGRFKVELDTDPLSEPTYAISMQPMNTPHNDKPNKSANSPASKNKSKTHNKKKHPTQTRGEENETILVACKNGLQLFHADSGGFIQTLGHNDIKCPQCIKQDSLGNLIVSDMLDAGSIIVTLERLSLLPVRLFCGQHVGLEPANDVSNFHKAWYFCVTTSGHVIISDREAHALKAYSQHGKFLWWAGGLGGACGELMHPAGIVEDPLGHILVADRGNRRVQMFSSSGDWLACVLDAHSHDLQTPVDVAIDAHGNLAVLQSSGTVSTFSYIDLL